MNAPNIALIRQRYSAFGGAEQFLARAITSLQAEGAKLTLITRQWPKDGSIDAIVCNPPYIGRWWRDMSFAREVCGILRKNKFDLVQSHERIACCDIYRAGDGVHREWLQQRARTLNVWENTAIKINPYHRYVLAAEKRLFLSKRLKAIICNSYMVRDEILNYFKLPEQKLHVIYSGVDLESFNPSLRAQYRSERCKRYGVSENATIFLFVGSGFERKGLQRLLQAFAMLQEKAHLFIVGKDKHIKYYMNLAHVLGIAQRVQFMGAEKDVRPYYGMADALVLPTLYDPFPNVALEAFATGVPVITSIKSGAAELVQQEKNGYVCDALDVAGLANHMRQICHLTDRESFAVAARQTVEKMSLKDMADRMLSLYQDILHEHNNAQH